MRSRSTAPSRREGRASNLALGLLGLGLLGVLATLVLSRRAAARGPGPAAEVVRHLGLTDLCLATEARYTRHLSQADLFSAFQDHPGGLEWFPTGAILRPPWSSVLPVPLEEPR